MKPTQRLTVMTLALALTGLAAPALADDGGMVYYSVGGNLLNQSVLNTAIAADSYAGFDGWTWGQGAGLYGVFRRFLVGGELQSFWGQLRTGGSESMRIDGGYGLFQFGYVAVANPSFQLYPYLGIGWGGMSLHASQKLNTLLSVSQGSNDQIRVLNGGNLLLDLGLGINYTVPMSPENGGDARGPSLGLRAGWLFAPGQTTWTSNELPVTGGPNAGPGGFYVRAMLGFGGYQ